MQQESNVCSLEALIEELNFFGTPSFISYQQFDSNQIKPFFNNQ